MKNKFTMCYLGSLGTCYMLKEMAQFFNVLKKKVPDAFWLIISTTDKTFINNILRKEGIKDYKIICVKPEEVFKHLSQCKFSIMFIKKTGESAINCSPTKFAESLACGIPVLINKGIGDTEDIIKMHKVGVILEDFTESSYEKAVIEMLELLKK